VHLFKLKGDNYTFGLGKREKRLFTEILRLYPLIPPAHHRLSRSASSTAMESHQRLLDEALAEQRAESKSLLETMLAEDGRFTPTDSGFQFSVNRSQIEWLLQVLNDIRVGSWLILGEPDENKGKLLRVTPDNTHYVIAMEGCSHFQCELLRALEEKEESH